MAGSNETSALRLHRAAHVIPVASPPISDGAVLVESGLIRAVGPYGVLRKDLPAGAVCEDHGGVALLPSLVNAHTHLELSGFKGGIPLPQPGFPAWLKALFTCQAARDDQAIDAGSRELLERGIGCFGDITNGAGLGVSVGSAWPTGYRFLEVLGFNEASLEAALSEHAGALASGRVSLAAHACYSTSAALIAQAKAWCRKQGRPFSIHVAEHPEEIAFLRDGSGFCRDLLESLGRWVPGWIPPGMTPIGYLDRLGVLDERTILVHAAHLGELDWRIVAQRRCPVCFCPRSNRNLGVGTADIAGALRRGITGALGTDSLASNTDLSLFAEAQAALDSNPGLHPEAVLTMMTHGGARALQLESQFGSLQPGRLAAILAVPVPEAIRPAALVETVIDQGYKGVLRWASSPMTH